MSNLKRYSYTSEGMISDENLGIVGGAFVKFDDIKEFLKPTANKGMPKCKTCRHKDISDRAALCKYNYTAGTKGCFALRQYL